MQRNWRNLIKTKPLEISELTDTYGRFVAEPLERGFGQTLGISLRRILLSSIRGAAITGLQIAALGRKVRDEEERGKTKRRTIEDMQPALHEFSTLSDVVEDVADIILNLKEVNIKMNGEGPKTATLVAECATDAEPFRVTAGMIETDADTEILNVDQHILTVAPGGRVEMQLTIKEGVGYVPAERNKDPEVDSVDLLPVDAIFSPVRRVNFKITNARVEQRTDYDKLTIEVWTNGAVDPETAVGIAAKILKEQLKIFIPFEEEIEEESKPVQTTPAILLNENLYKRIDELELSARSANCLQNANIRHIGELVQKTEAELLRTKNFGRKSLKEIKEVLSEMDLQLGMRIDGFDPERRPATA